MVSRMSSTVCPNCSRRVGEGLRFCPDCGQLLGPTRPPAYLTETILTFFFCCFPASMVAYYHGCQVDSKFDRGDMEGALASSASARKWNTVSIFLGIATYIALGVLFVLWWNNVIDPIPNEGLYTYLEGAEAFSA